MTATTWTNRIWRERHAGNLTATMKDVLLTLATYRARGGSIHPSHATLASRAACKRSTVQRALQAARDLGLVRWVERRVRRGWRSLRTSNRYELVVPDRPVSPRERTKHHFAAGTFKRKNPATSSESVPSIDRAEAVRALAQRRAVVEARLLETKPSWPRAPVGGFRGPDGLGMQPGPEGAPRG